MTGRRAGLLLCCALGWGAPGAELAAPPSATDFVVDAWQMDAGLPHNSVTAVLQTRDGYLWVGTSNGVARFDGVRFTTYRVVDNPGLKSNRILCLYEDRDGRLWIGTEEGGLARYRQGGFITYTSAEGLSSETILCLGEDHAGGFWVGTAAGLNRRAGETATTVFQSEGLSDHPVFSMYQPRSGPMLIASQDGLYRFSQERLINLAPQTPGSGNGAIFCLQEDRAGRLWAGGELGLFQLPAPNLTNSVVSSKIPWAKVLVMREAADGQIWFGTSAGELYRIPETGDMVEPVLTWHFQSPVTALCEDHEGNFWVGTAGHGLHRLKTTQLRWIPFAEGLGESRAVIAFDGADGEPWLLVGDKELYRFKDGRFVFVERLPLPEGTTVQTVCATADGRLWIGTASDGLFEYHRGAARQFSERDGLSDSAIAALCAEAEGGVWIGTRNGGLNHLRDRKVRRFNTPWGFGGGFARALLKDHQGNLWIGTTGDGLFKLAGDKFVAYTETHGLPSSDIRALQSDPSGSVWVASGRGLCRVGQEGVTVFSGRSGLAEDAIVQLRADGESHLWIGSSSGLYRLHREQLESYAAGKLQFLDAVIYGREDGLPGVQLATPIQSSAWPARAGRVWFTSNRGLVVGAWQGLRLNRVPPRVLLEGVLVENESVPVTELVRVPPGKESLQFRYTALSLTAPGKVAFRYRLEGFDRDWSEVTANRSARYPRVPPGRYEFRVMARNNDGVWNESGASVALVVLPFWWQTLWFRAGLVAAPVLAVAGWYRLRRARRRELERLRVRIAGDLHDEVGSSLWSITLLSRMLARHQTLPSQLKQDIEEIHRISVQTSNSIRDIIWLINPAFDSLHELVLRLKDSAGTMLRGISFHIHTEGVDLARKLPPDIRQNLFLLFKEALTNIAKHACATEVEVRLEETADRWSFVIRDNGVGFDPAAETSGNGLKNLRARAQKMRAEFEIRSQPGDGTRLVFSIDKP